MSGEKSGTVIVVDDDPMFRDELVTMLEEEGYEVQSFESGAHAVRYMQDRPWCWVPKLLITDLVMEGVGGYQLIRRIQELYPGKNVPIIVVSRLYSADYVYEAEVAGAASYLQKPVQPQKLIAAIQKAQSKAKGPMAVF